MLTALMVLSLAAEPPKPDLARDTAQGFLTAMKGHHFDEALAKCNPTMKQALAAHPLKEIWEGFEKEVGPLDAFGPPKLEVKDAFQLATFEADFKQARRSVRVVVDGSGEVAGLFWAASKSSLELKAKKLVEQLTKGQYGEAVKGFGPKLTRAMPKDKLEAAWKQLLAQAGEFQSAGAVTLEPAGAEFTVVYVDCKFSKGPFRVKAAYDLKERQEGLFFVPGEAVSWAAPPYADAAKFDERPVVVKSNGVDLPGFLTVPKGDGPFPAVVLVHGSGPADADESVGAIKVFKDLAQGLSSHGVLVLRYTKRTKVVTTQVATVEDEVIDAVRAAVTLLSTTKEADPKQLTVVGHSQGAYLAPRIAKEVKGIKAIVMLAAPARSIDALLEEQLDYLTRNADPKMREDLLAKQKKFKEQIHSQALKPEDDVPFPVGGVGKGKYYLDLRSYDPVKTVAALGVPAMLLQGGRDYQVSPERDFGLYKQALTGKSNVVLRLFPSLNHLMVGGTGASTPAEYDQPGHVDVDVVTAIAAFANPAVHKNP